MESPPSPTWETASKVFPDLFKAAAAPPPLPTGGPPPLSKRSHEVDYKIIGESIFMTHFTNRGAGKKHVAFAAPYPGTVVPIDLSTLGVEPGGPSISRGSAGTPRLHGRRNFL